MRIVILAALALTACGEATPPTATASIAAPPLAWETRLTEMLPYIDACIAKSPQTRTVSYAGPLDEESVVVRLGGAAGEFQCTVPMADPVASNAVIFRDDETVAFEGEGSALFVRGPGDNPGGECYAAPEVRDANGDLIGWMLDPEGC